MRKKLSLAITLIAVPAIALAQTSTLATVISTIVGYFNDILGLIMGLAVVMFVWYVIQYFIQPNDKRAEGAQYVMWAVIGFFVILSMWGIVNILTNTFNLGNNNPSSWSSISNLFPTDGGSGSSGGSGSNNIFNQGSTASYNTSPTSNSSSGFTSGSQSSYGTSGGTQGGTSNSFSPFGSSGNTGTTNYSSGGTGTVNSGTGANATTAINNPSNNLNAGGTVSSQSNGVIYYANGQYYDTKTGINYNSSGQQISSPNYNASTGQYTSNSATGSTGNTTSGQTSNPPDVSGRINQMQVSNGCLDSAATLAQMQVILPVKIFKIHFKITIISKAVSAQEFLPPTVLANTGLAATPRLVARAIRLRVVANTMSTEIVSMGVQISNQHTHQIIHHQEIQDRIMITHLQEVQTPPLALVVRVVRSNTIPMVMTWDVFNLHTYVAQRTLCNKRIKGHQLVTIGTMDTLLVHPREVFRTAVVGSAASIVLMHNHPSGEPTPSEADIKVTRDLIRAGQLLKIDVIDHIIMGGGDKRSSLRELGYFYS